MDSSDENKPNGRQRDYRGWHGPMVRLPDPPEPAPGLGMLDRICWHIREYLRPNRSKSVC